MNRLADPPVTAPGVRLRATGWNPGRLAGAGLGDRTGAGDPARWSAAFGRKAGVHTVTGGP